MPRCRTSVAAWAWLLLLLAGTSALGLVSANTAHSGSGGGIITNGSRAQLWPKLGAIRGWAFAYNFTNTTLYPVGTANLYAGLNPEAASWDTKHGIAGYEALLKSQAMAQRGILPLIWEYCWNSPYPKVANRSTSSVVEYFARDTFPFPWVAGTAVDECNKAEIGYAGERALAAQGFRAAKLRNPGKLLAGWGANAGDEIFASLMADGTFDLALVEGYTYCAEAHGDWPAKADVCANKGTPHIEQYFSRLDYARQKGYLNRTVFTFGFMLGASAVNPNAWTPAMLRTAMLKLKTAYLFPSSNLPFCCATLEFTYLFIVRMHGSRNNVLGGLGTPRFLV